MAAAAELPSETRAALRDGRLDAAMFFSPRTAGLFLELAQGLPVAGLTAFCISPNTARALPHGAFADVRVAAKPNQTAMLDLVGPA
jgi:uroporphyrinogen-III synthase